MMSDTNNNNDKLEHDNMNIKTIKIGLEQIVPHETNTFLNRKPYVEITADINPGEDTIQAYRHLQTGLEIMMAEAVEQAKRAMRQEPLPVVSKPAPAPNMALTTPPQLPQPCAAPNIAPVPQPGSLPASNFAEAPPALVLPGQYVV